MKKQALLFGLIGASVVALGVAHRKNKAVSPAAERLGVAVLRRSSGRLIRSMAVRSLAGIATVWAVGRLCEKAVPKDEIQ